MKHSNKLSYKFSVKLILLLNPVPKITYFLCIEVIGLEFLNILGRGENTGNQLLAKQFPKMFSVFSKKAIFFQQGLIS